MSFHDQRHRDRGRDNGYDYPSRDSFGRDPRGMDMHDRPPASYSGPSDRNFDDSPHKMDRSMAYRHNQSSSWREGSSSKSNGGDDRCQWRSSSRQGHNGDYGPRHSQQRDQYDGPSPSSSQYDPFDDGRRDNGGSNFNRSSHGDYYDDRSSRTPYQGNGMDAEPWNPQDNSSFRHPRQDGNNYSPEPQQYQSQQDYYNHSHSSSSSMGIPPEYYQPTPPMNQGDSYSSLRSSEAVYTERPSQFGPSRSFSSSSNGHQTFSHNSAPHDNHGDYNTELSISRAITQPLEPQHASSSSQSNTAPPPPPANIEEALIASLRETLGVAASLGENKDAFKKAIEASIASLQTLTSLEAKTTKARATQASNLQQITKDEISLARAYSEYLAADLQVRIIDADLVEARRVMNDLEQPDGDWQEPSWTLLPLQGYADHLHPDSGNMEM